MSWLNYSNAVLAISFLKNLFEVYNIPLPARVQAVTERTAKEATTFGQVWRMDIPRRFKSYLV